MSDRVVHSWPKNAHEDVYATIGEYRGHHLASIRVYVVDENDALQPTRKGTSVRIEDLPKLKQSVDALMAEPRPASGQRGRATPSSSLVTSESPHRPPVGG